MTLDDQRAEAAHEAEETKRRNNAASLLVRLLLAGFLALVVVATLGGVAFVRSESNANRRLDKLEAVTLPAKTAKRDAQIQRLLQFDCKILASLDQGAAVTPKAHADIKAYEAELDCPSPSPSKSVPTKPTVKPGKASKPLATRPGVTSSVSNGGSTVTRHSAPRPAGRQRATAPARPTSTPAPSPARPVQRPTPAPTRSSPASTPAPVVKLSLPGLPPILCTQLICLGG